MSDGNERLDVLIIGAGIAGLSAAIALGKQGHRVVILERSRFLRETGAAIHLPPNCTALLQWMGIDPEPFGGTRLEEIHRYDVGGNLKFKQDYAGIRQHWQAEWYLIHRVDLHKSLRLKAIETAELHLECKIASINIETSRPSVVLDDGRVFHADVLLGADGLHSQARPIISPGASPYPVGTSCLRWLLPVDDLKNNESTKRYVDKRGIFLEWGGKDRRLVAYPCSDNKIMNLCAFMPSEEARVQDTQSDGWQAVGDKQSILQGFSEFTPAVQNIIQSADQSLKVWDLYDMDPLATWVKGHTALLGDAAHPFQPYLGQGGAMAIEDAVSIATLLPLGTKMQDIPARLSMYHHSRRPRVEMILHYTRLNGRREDDENNVRITPAEMIDFMKICISYNERETSQALLDRCNIRNN
ncbi:hypothetical protein PENSTE_c002G06657 [Penicillium steckii]|uniref:FAD-binding domain-containing protein n=1 Tax=Penicillium steckii TaxID=303698 RepID=A0A1V6TTY2_9EURO|nr:hypothetical protein PENSTE_c002G06657 [Penicillium steckii]